MSFVNPSDAYRPQALLPAAMASPAAAAAALPAIPSAALPLPQNRMELEPQIDYTACIQNLLRSVPAAANVPAEGRTILEELLSLAIRYRTISDPLSLEKRQLHQAVTQKQAQFSTYCQAHQILLPIDASTSQPSLLPLVNEEAGRLANSIIAFRKQELVQNCRRDVTLSQLSPREFDQLHLQCSEEMQSAHQAKAKLATLIQFAKVPESLRDAYKIDVIHTGNGQTPFALRAALLPMGYSIHDLLFGLDLRAGNYEGADLFYLNCADLKKLNDHLSNLILWIDDFTLIVGDLIGDIERAREFITLGQKPVSEIMRNPIRMSHPVVSQLPSFHDMPCLLFNQVSLDLVQHPERDFLKARLIEFFRIENMIGSNGRPKDFLEDCPYQTVLNVEQVMKICPRLNKLLKFQQLVKEYTGASTLQQALHILRSEFGLPNELEVMKQYKIGILNQTSRSLLGLRTPADNISYFDRSLSLCSTIDELEGKSLQLCEDFLTQCTGTYFRTNAAAYTPSVEEIRALYEGQRMAAYRGNQNHRNVAKLFSRLRESAPCREALAKHRHLEASVAELEAEFIRRLNDYHGLSPDSVYYGRPMVDEAVSHLEQYVAKIVYAAQSRVTQDSVERSLMVLAGRNGSDMSHGCGRGFAGRINDMLIALTTSVGNDLQDHMIQFRKDCLEAIYHEVSYYRDSSESSMAIPDKAEAGKFLGIVDARERTSYRDLNERVKTILHHFFMRYHSTSVYHKARTFFSDKFWQLNKDNDDENIYQLFAHLGFGNNRAELDKKYRVNGDPANKWQYAYFQQDLPQYLVPFLVQEGLLFVKPHFGLGAVIHRQGEEPCALPFPEPMDVSPVHGSAAAAALSSQELVDRARLAARAEAAAEPSRRAGQILASRLPDYQPSTS